MDTEMSYEERKELFRTVRSSMHKAAVGELKHEKYSKFWGISHRSMLLLWGFLRGFPYKRIERKTREQVMPDGSVTVHNQPNVEDLAKVASCFLPGDEKELRAQLADWLKNPDGAIPAPPPRVKKPYVASSPSGVAAE